MMTTCDLSRYFYGAVRFTESDGFITPHRFTVAQEAHYTSIGEGALIRACCTAGVSLAFSTSASEISFDYRAACYSRPYVGFDIYENDCLTAHIQEPDQSEAGHVVYKCCTEGMHQIEIYLSCLNEISIGNANFGTDAEPLSVKGEKLLFLGDSITQGMTSKCPSLVYPTLYARKCGAELLNHGVGGAKFDVTHLDDMPDYAPDRIFVAYGINDLYEDAALETQLAKAEAYLKRLRALYPSVGCAVITPVWNARITEESDFAMRFVAYSTELTRIAASLGFEPQDGLKLVPNALCHFVDGTHPNEQGFALYALGLM